MQASDHNLLDLEKKKKSVYIYIYIFAKKILYAKLTYCDYLNKNFEHPELRITKF